MKTKKEKIRIAALGDLHFAKTSQGKVQKLFDQMDMKADMLLLAGDLTDYGLPEEAHLLAKELNASVNIPMIGVLGNHDFESGKASEVQEVLLDAGITILDGDSCEVRGVGIAGIKGFAGGFGRFSLGFWGEPLIKTFVQEALNEALKLETALARLRTPHRIALLHYSPIKTTVEGEPPEIYPYLGSSRLEEPLSRYPVTAIFHGHAHKGQLEGRTMNDVPVYNVSLPLLQKSMPDGAPVRIFEITLDLTPTEEPHDEVRAV